MPIFKLLQKLFDFIRFGRGKGVTELARRLGMDEIELREFTPSYHEFSIPKRSGGKRRIAAPDRALKQMQRRIQRRLLQRLRSHPAAIGFERGQSIVTGARQHVGQAVLVCLDLRDFFNSTSSDRVRRYFRKIGWNRDATAILVGLCTFQGALPQGAPTSPRLSNLVNFRLDTRLSALARRFGAIYTRYADDLTFSFEADDTEIVGITISTTRRIIAETGYRLHLRKKLRIRRRHQSQRVTGLVVNDRVNLPRATRRRLRAIEHRARMGGHPGTFSTATTNVPRPTLKPSQQAGWRSFQQMVACQAAPEEH